MAVRPRWPIVILSVCLTALSIGQPALAVPPLPSSFYGAVKINNANVPDGTLMKAIINGKVVAESTTQTYGGASVYALDVPGDIPETTALIEGGREGDAVSFSIGGIPADQTGVWHSGTNVKLDLSAVSALTPVALAPTATRTSTPAPTWTSTLAPAPTSTSAPATLTPTPTVVIIEMTSTSTATGVATSTPGAPTATGTAVPVEAATATPLDTAARATAVAPSLTPATTGGDAQMESTSAPAAQETAAALERLPLEESPESPESPRAGRLALIAGAALALTGIITGAWAIWKKRNLT